MTIILAHSDDKAQLRIVDGRLRLKAQIQAFGQAKVLLDGKEAIVEAGSDDKTLCVKDAGTLCVVGYVQNW